jgi:hypothetical protein
MFVKWRGGGEGGNIRKNSVLDGVEGLCRAHAVSNPKEDHFCCGKNWLHPVSLYIDNGFLLSSLLAFLLSVWQIESIVGRGREDE